MPDPGIQPCRDQLPCLSLERERRTKLDARQDPEGKPHARKDYSDSEGGRARPNPDRQHEQREVEGHVAPEEYPPNLWLGLPSSSWAILVAPLHFTVRTQSTKKITR